MKWLPGFYEVVLDSHSSLGLYRKDMLVSMTGI